VTRVAITFGPAPRLVRTLLLFLVPAAVLAGLYGRFKGIGLWPLGVDEFYTSRSIDHVLLTGWPRFPCGGYYTRGLLFQYVVAGLRWSGLLPEFAGRFVSAVCSVAVWPAIYLIARRIQGSVAGWVVVIILAVSIWEIEMARFLRMYAPFQAVFTWYLVFYLRYVVDRDTAALRWMIGLSVLGVLTWEGGALLGVANLFAIVQSHEHGRLKAADWARLAGLLALLGLLVLATRDLRGFGETTIAAAPTAQIPPHHFQFPGAWLAALRQHPGWACGFLLPLGVAAASLPWIWSRRREWLLAAALCAALAGAAGHEFMFTAGVLALMLLLRLIDWGGLTARNARWFLLAIAAFVVFWFAFAHWTDNWSTDAGIRIASRVALPAAYQHLLGFPDIYDDILLPWARAVPLLSLELAAAIAFACWRAIAAPSTKDDPGVVLLALLVIMVMVIGATPTPRVETRYSFFLYPLMIVLAVSAVAALAQRQRNIRYAPFLAVAPLLLFIATEDFKPGHIAQIDTAETNFRVGIRTALAEHYYPRNDMRGIARWLAANVQPGDIVIAGIPSLDEYYAGFDYFYMDADDERYEDYICPDGRTDRWTSHPVLHGIDALKPLLAAGHQVYATVYSDTEGALRQEAARAGWRITRAWTAADGRSDVLRIVANST
jgi:hypothetical protein